MKKKRWMRQEDAKGRPRRPRPSSNNKGLLLRPKSSKNKLLGTKKKIKLRR
jgi:hypothetical protein